MRTVQFKRGRRPGCFCGRCAMCQMRSYEIVPNRYADLPESPRWMKAYNREAGYGLRDKIERGERVMVKA